MRHLASPPVFVALLGQLVAFTISDGSAAAQVIGGTSLNDPTMVPEKERVCNALNMLRGWRDSLAAGSEMRRVADRRVNAAEQAKAVDRIRVRAIRTDAETTPHDNKATADIVPGLGNYRHYTPTVCGGGEYTSISPSVAGGNPLPNATPETQNVFRALVLGHEGGRLTQSLCVHAYTAQTDKQVNGNGPNYGAYPQTPQGNVALRQSKKVERNLANILDADLSFLNYARGQAVAGSQHQQEVDRLINFVNRDRNSALARLAAACAEAANRGL